MINFEITEIPTAPPALLIMLQQFSEGGEWNEIRKRIRAALRDMKDQSLAFESQNINRIEPENPLQFEIHPHGALDLLSGDGCREITCRVAASERLARSLGLIADRIWLTDHLSTEVVTLGRATNESIDRLMEHAVALAPLLPLIKAGIIRFRSPWTSTCSACAAEFDSQVELATEAVFKMLSRQIKVEQSEQGGYFVRTGNLFVPPLFIHSNNSSDHRVPSSRDFAKYLLSREVRAALWTTREAMSTGGAVFSNSRAALAGMLQCEGRLPRTRSELQIFEDSRAFNVPWISNLTPSQVLQLREEASAAIPRFREMLARSTTFCNDQKTDGTAMDLIADLREQAAEVRAELTAKQAKSARYWKTVYGVLGFGLSAYGVATDQVIAGVGGLLPIIQLLIEHKTSHGSAIEEIKNRPGYVLVKAQDILSHAQ